MSRRIAILTGIPAPYREPVFANLARRPGIDLHVFYCADGHGNVAWKPEEAERLEYPRTFVANLTPKRFRRLPFLGYANLALKGELERFAPDYMIVYGYNQLAHWLAFAHCRRHGTPFALRSDSNALVDGSATWRSAVRRSLLRRLVKRASGFLAVGSANRDYWKSYGATDEQIFSAPYAVDNARIATMAGAKVPDPEGRTRFLYAGRLIPRKGVDLLMESFNRLADRNATLTIIGDGPERERLQAMQSPEAAARTLWTGKITNAETLRYYGRADVFTLPARYEPWGLVVNEAMAAGCPVIAERKCGAALDLIEDRRSGRVLETMSADSLFDAMREYCDDPALAAAHGAAAQRRVQAWNFDRTVDGFMTAIGAETSPSMIDPISLVMAGVSHA